MIYCSKKWLSARSDETGSMVCKAESPRVSDMYSDTPSVDASVAFRSCYGEPCSLDFNIQSDKGLQRRIEKVDIMINELVEFKAQLPLMWEDAKKVAEEYKVLHADDEPGTRRGLNLHVRSEDDE